MEAQFESSFVHKYGPVNFEWITPPDQKGLVLRPYALNYFADGKLYRTKGERGSSVFELFFDLLYVGLVANLAKAAIEEATGSSFVKYLLLFLGAWQIWADMKEFMNYYYNNDITQKMYVLWIMALLIVYANNANFVLESKQDIGMVVGSYIVARFSAMLLIFVYSFFIPQHRIQMRLYTLLTCFSLLIAGFIIIAPLKGKIILTVVSFAFDTFNYILCFHPWTKHKLNIRESTAINIEHEVERYGAFVIIALGEYLYEIVASSPAATGFNERTARCVCVLVTAYCILWFYFRGEGSVKAVHALRRSATTAFSWIYLHVPLIIALIISADAAGVLTETHVLYPYDDASAGDSTKENMSSEERPSYLHSVQIYYGAALAVALLTLSGLAMCDKTLETTSSRYLPSMARFPSRILVAGAILGMSFSRIKITLFLGLISLLVTAQLMFESIGELPRAVCDKNDEEKNISDRND